MLGLAVSPTLLATADEVIERMLDFGAAGWCSGLGDSSDGAIGANLSGAL